MFLELLPAKKSQLKCYFRNQKRELKRIYKRELDKNLDAPELSEN